MLQRKILTVLTVGVGLAAGGVDFISHRGESADAPENTMAAFQLAWERDSDGIELDIHRTRDGELVVCHDENTKRTSGVDCLIRDTDYATLAQLDFGSFKGPGFAGERIPLLSDVLARVPAGKQVFIEIKPDDPEVVNALQLTLAAADLAPEQITIISFHPDMVRRAVESMPEHATYLLAGWEFDAPTREYKPGIQPLIESGFAANTDGLDLAGYTKWPPEAVAAWRNAGFKLAVWTIDDPELARYYVDCGVTAVTSNCAAKIKQALRAK